MFTPQAGSNPVERIYKLKREVLHFLRATAPLIDPVTRLAQGHYAQVHPEVRTYFRDVNDHLMRARDQLEGLNDLLTSVLDANLTQISVRQNEDMRKISAWVAIAAVPTMIAGIYGMNFDEMPELHWELGYPAGAGRDGDHLLAALLALPARRLALIPSDAMPDDCIFCKIVAGELPAEVIVQEDEHTLAFMDINPWTRGHALVIPRTHSRNLYEVAAEDLAATAAGAKRLAERMRDRLGCAGVNLLNCCEARGLADGLPLPRPRDPALRGRPAAAARASAPGRGRRSWPRSRPTYVADHSQRRTLVAFRACRAG